MTRTNSTTRMLEADPDVAAPHGRADGRLQALAQNDYDNTAPAGSINSCAEEMAKWVAAQLNGGAGLFSAAQSNEMWSAQTIMPIGGLPRGAPGEMAAVQPQFAAYGLGWALRDYRGRKMVYHTGTMAGYVSRTSLIPDAKLGVVVLTNQEAAGAHAAITYTMVDGELGASPVDWVAAFQEMAKLDAARVERAQQRAAGSRNANSRPSLPPASYAGRYRDSWYGDVLIGEQDGGLTISFTHTPQLAGALEHWQYDTFVARWRERTLGADAYVTFAVGPHGAVEGARLASVSPLTDFSFDFQDLELRRV
jgi:hypothetical protein